MEKFARYEKYLWPLLLILLGVIVYAPGLGIKYYGDDYGYVLDATHTPLWTYWTTSNLHGWYRPLQMTYMALVQQVWGLSTFPIHIVQLVFHLGLAFCVYRMALDFKLSLLQARIAALWFLLSQVDPLAVQRTTTLASVSATFFGYFAIWLLLRQGFLRDPQRKIEPLLYFGSILFFLLSIFSKESSSIFLVLAAFVIFFVRLEPLRFQFRWSKTAILAFIPYLTAFGFYFLIRKWIGANQPIFGPDDYQFTMSFTVIKNLAMFLLAGFTPVSTVTMYVAAIQNPWLLALTLLPAILVLGVMVYGLASHALRKTGLILGICAILSLFPMAALNHISELYVYNALPFLSLLIGLGWGAVMAKWKSSPWASRALMTMLVALLFINVASLESKTALMVENGERAENILRQLVAISDRVPSGGQMVLVNPSTTTPSYSVFLVNGFNVFFGARQIVRLAAGRIDFSVKIFEEQNLGYKIVPAEDILLLTLAGNTVVDYLPPNDFPMAQ